MTSRESLVSSLYGPGTTICWLLTFVSVLVTWTLNPHHRRRDTITNDFIAVLALPSVASVHLIRMVSSFSGTPSELLTSTDPDIVQFAAAIEAPLTICESFAVLAVGLFAAAGLCGYRKRAICVLLSGLLAFATNVILFVQAFGVTVGISNLARPFLFNITWGMFVVLLLLLLIAVAFSLTADHIIFSPPPGISRSQSLSKLYLKTRRTCRSRTDRSGLISMLFTPFAFILSLSSGWGLFGATQFQTTLSSTERLLFFIPRSSTSLSELDQAVTVAGGVFALLFSFYDALYMEQRDMHDKTISALRARLDRIRLYELQLEEIYKRQEVSPDNVDLKESVDILRRFLTLELYNAEVDDLI